MSASVAGMAGQRPLVPVGSLHPGCEIALRRLGMNELDVAEAIRDGELTSPQRYENLWLFAIRITGTGVAFRAGLREYAIRDPKFYLTDAFLRRCNGLPVIIEHPPEDKQMLDTKEFKDRIVGTVFVPYIRDDEVWAVVKVLDQRAAKLMRDDQLSTSPAVVFKGNAETEIRLKTDQGNTLFFEPDPNLLDHIAVVVEGVWDKSGPPTGVDRGTETPAGAEPGSTSTGDSTMADNDEEARRKEEEEEKARADAAARGDGARGDTTTAAGRSDDAAKLDQILSSFDSVHKRLDDDRKARDDDRQRVDARIDAISKTLDMFRNDAEKRRADDDRRRRSDDARRRMDRFSKRRDDDDDDTHCARRDTEERELRKELEEEYEDDHERADSVARDARRMADRRDSGARGDATGRNDRRRDDDDDDRRRSDTGTRADKRTAPLRARWDAQACMDSFSRRRADDDDDKYRRRHDEEEESLAKKLEEQGEEGTDAKDRARKGRKDAEEREEKEAREDQARKDTANALKELDVLKKRMEALTLSDADREAFTDVQARADEVAQHYNKRARRFMPDESLLEYRIAMLRPYQKYSSSWKDEELSALPPGVLAIAERAIRTDAMAAARHQQNEEGGGGVLREIRSQDATGRTHIKFVGDFNACFAPWRAATRGARIRLPN